MKTIRTTIKKLVLILASFAASAVFASVTIEVSTKTVQKLGGGGTITVTGSGAWTAVSNAGSFHPLGSKDNPWQIGTPNAADVVAYTNGMGGLIITGTGAMVGFYSDTSPWYEGRSSIAEVTIDEGVTSIGKYAFSDCEGVTSVTIPSSVTSIGAYAFDYCPGLKSVTIPSSVTSIGVGAFSNCWGLESVKISDGVTNIGAYAFDYSPGLESVTIPPSVTSIGASAFACSSPTVYVAKGDTERVKGLYSWNLTTTFVELEPGCTIDDLWLVGESVFAHTNGVGRLVITGTGAMADFDTVASPWHEGRGSITEVEIDRRVTSIGAYAFSGCDRLADVTIPKSVTSIGEHAFSNCSALMTVCVAKGDVDRVKGLYSWSPMPTFVEIWPGDVRHPWEIGTLNAADVVAYTNGMGGLIITGTGAMKDFYSGTSPWYETRSSIMEVTIGVSVTSIGDYAFKGCSGLTSVTIPPSVTSIGYDAFYGCSGLTSVTIPPRVTFIDYDAFAGCSGLTSVTIPPSVTSIYYDAFAGCSGLTSVTIPPSVTSIYEDAFAGCGALTTVYVDKGDVNRVKRLYSWYSMTTFVELTPGSEQHPWKIGTPNAADVVAYTNGMGGLIITGTGAMKDFNSDTSPWYEGSSSIAEVTIGEGVTSIGYGAFEACSGLTEVTIPKGVTTIGDWTFYGCGGLTLVTIPSSVTSIGAGAFYGCSGLTSVTIPPSATSIGNGAFRNCSGLTSVTIPLSVMSIGAEAFSCDPLAIVYVDKGDAERVKGLYSWDPTPTFVEVNPGDLWQVGENVFAYTNDTGRLSIVGTGAMVDFDTVASPWYEGRSSITEVEIGNWVTSIGAYAFSGCDRLTDVTIPKGMTSIGARAFSGCSGITSLTIPPSVASIGTRAFYNCSALATVYVAKDDTERVKGLYSWNPMPTFVEIWPGNVRQPWEIGTPNAADVVAYTNGMGGLIITGTGTMVDFNSGTSPWYEGRSSIAEVTIDEGVTSIGYYAFYGCSGLTSVTIPPRVTFIGNGAFRNCSGLMAFEVDSSNAEYKSANGLLLTKDGETLVAGVNGDVVIPESVTSIGNFAFSGCSGLTSVTIPPSVTRIDEWAFRNCSGLTSVTIPSSVTSIGEYAFSGCSKLTTVYVDKGDVNRVKGLYAWNPMPTFVELPSGNAQRPWKIGTPNAADVVAYTNGLGKLVITGTGAMMDFDAVASPWCAGGSAIAEVTIGEGVANIGSCAFSDCEGVVSVTIPSSVTSIGEDAFAWCSGLMLFEVNAQNPAYRSANGLLLTKDGATVLAGINGEVVIPSGVTSIGASAFQGRYGLTAVTLSEGVTSIGAGAFADCDALASISMPPSVTSIGASAFLYCDSLATVYVAKGDSERVKRLCPWSPVPAFVELGEGSAVDPWKVGENVTVSTNGVGTLVIGGTGATGDFAESEKTPWLANALGITDAVIGDGVTEVGSRFFKKCYNLSTVTCGAGVTSFNAKAFFQCPALEKIVIANPDFNVDCLKDAITYRMSIDRDGNFVMVPSVTIAGHAEVLYGRDSLTAGDWEYIGPLATQNLAELKAEGKYHFFQTRLEKVAK